jgi:hypothetical protein
MGRAYSVFGRARLTPEPAEEYAPWLMTRKQRVTRVVYAAYVILVAAFVASSIAQVARWVFGSEPSGPGGQQATVGPACGRVINDEIAAIDAARAAAGSENGAAAARGRYLAARPSREPIALVRARCQDDPQGGAAIAALAHFDRAAEADAVRNASELSPVRVAAQSFIRVPTR